MKNVSVFKELYSPTPGRVRAYDQVWPSFVVLSGIRQSPPVSPFLFDFAVEAFLQNASLGPLDSGVELLPGADFST